MKVKRVKFKKVSVEDFAEILKMGAEAERKRIAYDMDVALQNGELQIGEDSIEMLVDIIHRKNDKRKREDERV